MPIETTLIEKTHTCRIMEYNRGEGYKVVGRSRTTNFCGLWRLLPADGAVRPNISLQNLADGDVRPNFPQNLYVDYCPFCGEWLQGDDRTAPPLTSG